MDDRVRDCCSDDDNLEEQPTERPDMRVRVCRVCGSRHIEVSVDPMQLGVKPT
jgi:hypothetical protein